MAVNLLWGEDKKFENICTVAQGATAISEEGDKCDGQSPPLH